MIIFSVKDNGVKLVADPHVAQTLDSAKLSLGRFFAVHEDMMERLDDSCLYVFGEWSPVDGITKLDPIQFSARDCYEMYMKEVAKQNEEAVSDSDGSI